MSDAVKVFVYGTFRPPAARSPPEDSRYYPQIAPFILSTTPARLNDANLYDLGTYPAARPGLGIVYGDLLTLRTEALPRMDRIEGAPVFFQRGQVTVENAHGKTEAWIYWAPEGLTDGASRIKSGDWLRRAEAPAEGPAQEATSPAQDQVDETLQSLVTRFAHADSVWLGTVRPDGRPHLAPVWHVWRQGRIYVLTQSTTVKAANIQAQPAVILSHPDPHNPVIVEGWATLAQAARARVRPWFQAKFDWDIDESPGYDALIEITPLKLLAWGELGEGRWRGAALFRVEPG